MQEAEVKQAIFLISKKECGAKSLEILNITSYFAAENIKTGLFLSLVVNIGELKACIKLLKKYSFVDSFKANSIINVKRTTQRIIRRNLKEEKKEEGVLKQALKLLAAQFSYASNLDHAMCVLSFVSEYEELVKISKTMPNNIVLCLKNLNRYKDACVFGCKALDFFKVTFGEMDKETITIQHNIGAILIIEGKFDEALRFLWPLYEKDVQFSGQKEVIDAIVCIARQLCELSHYDKALPIYQRLIANNKVLEANDNTLVIVWHDYALLLSDMGRHTQSLTILQDMLKKHIETLDPDDDDISQVKTSIAFNFLYQNKHNEALQIFQEVFDKRKIVLGENHADTLRTRRDMGLTLYKQGKYKDAFEVYASILGKFEEVLGKMHSDTLVVQGFLASILRKQDKNDEALEIYKDVYQKQCKVLGVNDIETLRVKYSIGSILLAQNKKAEALNTFEEVLKGFEEVLGPRHPETTELFQVVWLLSHTNPETIHSAARKGNMGKVLTLIQNGADVNGKDFNGETALHIAAKNNHMHIVKLLLKMGAFYNVITSEGKTPLQLTSHSKIKKFFTLIDKLFADVKAGNRVQVVKHISDDTSIVNAKDKNGNNPLHWAACKGYKDIIRLLLENDADVMHVTNKGNTPLHIATLNNHTEIVQVLLHSLNDHELIKFVNTKTFSGGSTALHVAAKNGRLGLVKILLEHGSIFDMKNKEGKSPLDVSEDENIRDLLKLTGELFLAAENGIPGIKDKLRVIQASEFLAVTTACNSEGYTFMQVAVSSKYRRYFN